MNLESGFVDLYKKMVMVAHQTEVMKNYIVGSGSGAEQFFEGFIVRLIEKDVATLYAAVDDVVEAGNFETGLSGHRGLFWEI